MEYAAPADPVVYFIEAEGLGLVKIGYSAHVEVRIVSLATEHGCPMRLIKTFPGSRWTERWLHTLFAEHRRTGEWFDAEPVLVRLQTLPAASVPRERPQRHCPCGRVLHPKAAKNQCGPCLRNPKRKKCLHCDEPLVASGHARRSLHVECERFLDLTEDLKLPDGTYGRVFKRGTWMWCTAR